MAASSSGASGAPGRGRCAIQASPPGANGHGYATLEYRDRWYRVYLDVDGVPTVDEYSDGRNGREWGRIDSEVVVESILARVLVDWLELAGCREWGPEVDDE